MIDLLRKKLIKLNEAKPLVLCLTNLVTMELIANSLLAIGAAPLITTCDEELDELIALSSCLYINLGTLNSKFIQLIYKAAEIAQKLHKPIVIDPVGAGASKIRTETARELLKIATVIRGNASEIIALEEASSRTFGVESIHPVSAAKEIAKKLSIEHACSIVVSGQYDFATDGKQEIFLPYGSPVMSLVTGMGCALTSIIAAFQTIDSSHFENALLATAFFGLCGQAASKHTVSPGTFRSHFLDAMHSHDFKTLESLYDQNLELETIR